MDHRRVESNTQRAADKQACCTPDVQGYRERAWFGRVLVAFGLGSAAFAALCCVAPFVLAGLLAAAGLGFMRNDAMLVGLFVAGIGVAACGFALVRRTKHT